MGTARRASPHPPPPPQLSATPHLLEEGRRKSYSFRRATSRHGKTDGMRFIMVCSRKRERRWLTNAAEPPHCRARLCESCTNLTVSQHGLSSFRLPYYSINIRDKDQGSSSRRDRSGRRMPPASESPELSSSDAMPGHAVCGVEGARRTDRLSVGDAQEGQKSAHENGERDAPMRGCRQHLRHTLHPTPEGNSQHAWQSGMTPAWFFPMVMAH